MSRSFHLIATLALTISTTIGCSNSEDPNPNPPPTTNATTIGDSPTTQTPPSSGERVETFRHDGVDGVDAPTKPYGGSLECNTIAPIASATPVRVRISDEVAPPLEQADIPNGTYVFIHGDVYGAARLGQPNFMLPASTLVVGDRSFEEVISDANTNTTTRTLGKLDSRSGGKVLLSCVFPAVAGDEINQDVVSYSKDADELTMERPFDGGVLRRTYRRQ